jgi:hypothetical protein
LASLDKGTRTGIAYPSDSNNQSQNERQASLAYKYAINGAQTATGLLCSSALLKSSCKIQEATFAIPYTGDTEIADHHAKLKSEKIVVSLQKTVTRSALPL